MNGTPRVLNRVLLALLGLLFLGSGALLIALATVPAVGRWWQDRAKPATAEFAGLAARTILPGRSNSWIWIVVSLALVLLIIAMVAWVANQGKGRTDILADEYGDEDDDGAAGRVVISGAVAEQALKSALSERTDLLAATVATYALRGQPALRVRVLPRQGVSPHKLAAEVSALVQALDVVTGLRTPVLLSIGSGARTRFTKAERVG
ncbi:MAG: hypothetical protein M3021_08125 [Actinomycetota bacterium]|uniref:hypothetical protein n=1 Tax=Paenarthrobacter sp. PH39-S1 TaxID=3046204 RepID=UPI0024BA8575|nr:hypothetical protein [Paenarthrobacter sp. PH39-S1]MDJ0354918.1 hypothetical protein [Paenarthrobacter sp. PH39-S1]MDQ6740321.1 hypothetical protein [Actinomycetota bacterium]